MTRRLAARALAVAALAAGCGAEPDPLPRACLGGPEAVLRAVGGTPPAGALADGTPLSRCVALARSDAELQSVGAAFTGAALELAARAPESDADAARLGYLVGAVRRGAHESPAGLAIELERRIEQAVRLRDAPRSRREAFERGARAGEAGA